MSRTGGTRSYGWQSLNQFDSDLAANDGRRLLQSAKGKGVVFRIQKPIECRTACVHLLRHFDFSKASGALLLRPDAR